MAYGLPTRGQQDWDDELNNSVESLRSDGQSASAIAETARSNATTAISIAQDAAAKVDAFRSIPDAATASLVTDGPLTSAALASTIEAARIQSVEDFVSVLDLRRDQGLVVAHCSDSTGYRSDQFFELGWDALMGSLWTDRPARVKRWDKDTETYSAWETWQTGAQSVVGTGQVYRDSYSIDRASLVGTPPEVGGNYEKGAEADTFWTVSGGRLKRGNAGDTGTRATLRSLLAARTTGDWRVSGTVKVPASASGEVEIMVTVGTESNERVMINVGATGNATAKVLWNSDAGTVATIATLAGAAVYGTDMAFALSLTGTTVGIALNGASTTATIGSTDAAKFNSANARVVFRSQINGTEFEDIIVTGSVSSVSTPDTPGVDFYNGGASGTTPDYHLARLATMYPVPVDLLVMNHMHNYLDAWTVDQCLANIQGFIDAFRVHNGKDFGVVVNSQNPRFGAFAKPVHEVRINALREYAKSKGWGYVASYEAFVKRPDRGRNLLVDDLHPAIGAGRQLQADVFSEYISSLSERRWTA